MSTFALLDDECVIERLFEHSESERDTFASRYGARYVYLPCGGDVGDRVHVDDDGEGVVVR